MDTRNVTETIDKSNTRYSGLVESLSVADRHQLLGAQLRLLAHRLRHNIPVLQDDVVRMLPYVDDAPEIGAAA